LALAALDEAGPAVGGEVAEDDSQTLLAGGLVGDRFEDVLVDPEGMGQVPEAKVVFLGEWVRTEGEVLGTLGRGGLAWWFFFLRLPGTLLRQENLAKLPALAGREQIVGVVGTSLGESKLVASGLSHRLEIHAQLASKLLQSALRSTDLFHFEPSERPSSFRWDLVGVKGCGSPKSGRTESSCHGSGLLMYS
jgi:hypothetical protein